MLEGPATLTKSDTFVRKQVEMWSSQVIMNHKRMDGVLATSLSQQFQLLNATNVSSVVLKKSPPSGDLTLLLWAASTGVAATLV